MSGFKSDSSRLIPVEGHPGLFRDSASNAIINTNTTEIEKRRKNRAKMQAKEHEINQLKTEVAEIKSLLQQLLER